VAEPAASGLQDLPFGEHEEAVGALEPFDSFKMELLPGPQGLCLGREITAMGQSCLDQPEP
jgi:hypothetical protein